MATLPKDTEKELVHMIGWKHLYWLERPRVAASGGGGRMGEENGSERERQANVLALRLSDGRFVPHRYSLMRFTMKYAEMKNIPLNNLNNRVMIAYRCHHTGQPVRVLRDYCWMPRYAEACRRILRAKVERDEQAYQQLQDLIDCFAPEPVVRPWHANGVNGAHQQQQQQPLPLAEQVQAAEAAAQALVKELASEEAAEEPRKQAKKAKNAKAKAKSKRARGMAGGKGEQGGNGGGSAAGGGGGGDAAAKPSVASLTAATGRLAMSDKGEEDHAQGMKREEGSPVEPKPPALAANDTLPPSVSSAHDDENQHEEEEDDEEAFQDYLLDKAPVKHHCPIGICLLTDPINAADGHIYQCAELENWIEMCRVKQQSLVLPMIKGERVPVNIANQYVKSDVGEFIEQQRQEWVARKGQEKEGGK